MRATFWALYNPERARREQTMSSQTMSSQMMSSQMMSSQMSSSCRDVHFGNVWLARPLRIFASVGIACEDSSS